MAEATLPISSFAAADAARVREAVACAHCGLPCLTTRVRKADKHFCCAGCQTVYEILTENGLGQFYQLSDNAGVTIRRTTRRDQFRYLDEPAVRERLVDFSDSQTSRVTFTIPTIHCVACVWLLENLFRLNPAIGAVSVNFPRREATIRFAHERLALSELVALLASLGYEPTLSFGALEGKVAPVPGRKTLLLRLGLAGFAFGNIMLISLCLYAGLDSRSVAKFGPLFGWVSFALALPVFLFSAGEFWRAAWLGFRQRVLTIDQPIAVGIAAIFAWSTWEIASGTGHGYFDSLCALIFLLLIGRWFQQKTYDHLSFDRDFKSFFPLAVNRVAAGREESIPLSQLAVGDHLIIRHGDLIPADARLRAGEALVDYSFVTGEANPVTPRVGEVLYAGGQQRGGAIEIETIKPVSQSYLTSLWAHEAFAKNRDRSLDNILNRFSKRFVILVSLVAVGTAAVWWGRGEPATALRAFTAVLIVACPCALALSAPFALGTAQRLLARRRIFLKNTHVLESLARITTVVFDKTGTLTEREQGAASFVGESLSAAEAAAVAALAGQSAHPLSRRIAARFPTGADLPVVSGFVEAAGKGLRATIAGRVWLLGSAAWLEENGVPQADPAAVGHVWLAVDGAVRGRFLFDNPLRPATDRLLDGLARTHELALLSGDNERERERFLALFGPRAELRFNHGPVHKLGFIEALQRGGKSVMMVGDGLNDAGALRQSDVGVAVVEKVGAFSPASDVILEAQRVPELDKLMRFASGTVRIVWISIAISSAYNVVGLTIAATGRLSPLVCAILMPISSISVVGFAVGAAHWLARRTQLSETADPMLPSAQGTERWNKGQAKTREVAA